MLRPPFTPPRGSPVQTDAPLLRPSLLLSLSSLRLSTTDVPPASANSVADVGALATKRKATSSSSSCAGHYGLSSDSALALRFVALSRLMRTRDDPILEQAATTPMGVATLAVLRSAMQRVAVSVGGADPSLNEQSMNTLFNLSASTIAAQRLYDSATLSLPSKLPWPNAKALVGALLNSLAAARTADTGYRVGERLLQLPAPPMDAAAHADLTALTSLIECEMRTRLAEGGSAASSSASSRSTPPPLPAPIAPIAPPPIPLPAAAVEPFAIDATLSLSMNAHRLIAASLRRPLRPDEAAAMDEALDEALSVLQAGDAAARRQLLATNALAALTTPSAAFLWASCVEATEGTVASVAALQASVVKTCSEIAAVLFASAMGL